LPFTFAHPVVVIPIKNKWPTWFSLTGLVVGSMAPDFEYFIRMKTVTTISHTSAGILLFDLPIVLLVSYVFNSVIKKPLLLNLPSPFNSLYEHLPPDRSIVLSTKTFWVYVLSAFVGVLTHLLWDSFTHINGAFVVRSEFLSSYLTIFSTKVPIYKILQHGSTLLGLVSLFIYLRNLALKRKTLQSHRFSDVPARKKVFYWLYIILISIIISGLRVMFSANGINIGLLGIVVSSMVAGGMIGLLVMSVLYNYKHMGTL